MESKYIGYRWWLTQLRDGKRVTETLCGGRQGERLCLVNTDFLLSLPKLILELDPEYTFLNK